MQTNRRPNHSSLVPQLLNEHKHIYQANQNKHLSSKSKQTKQIFPFSEFLFCLHSVLTVYQSLLWAFWLKLSADSALQILKLSIPPSKEFGPRVTLCV